MDTVQNLKAFIAVAESGSFSGAARRASLATSVMAKRVDQLEARIGVALFTRTTRKLTLTEAGLQWLARVRTVVGDFDNLLTEVARGSRGFEGALRVKVPTTLAALYIGEVLGRFQAIHPRVIMEVVLTDRALNPIIEGFDIAVSVFGAAYAGVVDVPLCPLQRALCASPGYLAEAGVPAHPRELAGHSLLSFQPRGDVWIFESRQGPVTVGLQPRMSANDGQVLLAAARAGNGIALLSNYVAAGSLRDGTLVRLLQDFPVPEIWVKALVPESRLSIARVQALLAFLQTAFASPGWDEALP